MAGAGYTIDYSSGVYIKEENRATRPTAIATSVGAAVFASKRGSIRVPYPATDVAEFRNIFGNADPTVSFGHYAVEQFLGLSDICWCLRVVDEAKYGGFVVSKKISNQLAAPQPTVTVGVANGSTLTDGVKSYRIVARDAYGASLPGTAGTGTVVTSATNAFLETALTGSNNDLRYRAVTAGTVGNSNTITYVVSGNNTPLSVVITPNSGYAAVVVNVATDGSAAATSTANQILLALAAQGAAFSQFMTVALAAGNDGTGIVTALSSTPLATGAAFGANDGRAVVSWAAVVGATSYDVYGRVSGSELLMTPTPITSLSFIDTGIVTPAGALPVANTTGDIKITPFSAGEDDPATTFVFDPDDMFIVYAENPGAWNDTLRGALSAVNTAQGTFTLELYNPGQTVPFESWEASRGEKIDGYGRQLDMEERINALSSNIRVRNNPMNSAVVDRTYLVPTNMYGGDDGNTITDADIMLGWEKFVDKEEIDVRLLINGGYATAPVHLKMDEIASNRKDSLAILDTPSLSQDVVGALTYRNSTLNLDSSYSALFTSDQLIVDPINDKRLHVPPSGFIAAAMAYTDRNFASYFAPAGMERGNVRSLGSRHKYNQGQRNLLARAQVNYIRTFNGQGNKIWEQFTLAAAASPLQLISVRMLMILLQGTISNFLLFNVFDPNDSITRARIVGRIKQFLDTIVAGRGLYRYDVVCDETNNKPYDIDEGLLKVDVYVNPVIPARRILLTTIITPTGAEFKEAVLLSGGAA